MIPLDELGDDQFESLVVELARELFGEAIQGFTKGRDGGRDARFVGTAERFPSAASPWTGVTIIQAKHDNGLLGHYAESSFGGEIDSSVITGEIKKLQKLRNEGDLDNYLLVSNRRLSGGINTKICQRISEEVGIDVGSVHLWGTSDLVRLMSKFPLAVDAANLRWADKPLEVSSEDLCEVILAIADAVKAPLTATASPVVPRTSYEEKNVLNNMPDAFARALESKYLKYTQQIQHFLTRPENNEIRERYESAVDEFQLKIISKTDDYETFDQVFIHLTDLLIRKDPVLATRASAQLVRAVIFYMYWFCDIGVSKTEW